jgi:hypothetical protein
LLSLAEDDVLVLDSEDGLLSDAGLLSDDGLLSEDGLSSECEPARCPEGER